MQLDLSRITLGTPLFFRHAAVARPDGPAPTITGPGTNTAHRGGDREEVECWLFIL